MTAPRVNSALLSNYIQTNVRLVGKVHSIDNTAGNVVLETCDHKAVTVVSQIIKSGELQTQYVTGSCVEVIGQVQNDGTVMEYYAINFGTEFDLDNYNTLLGFVHGKYSNLFIPV